MATAAADPLDRVHLVLDVAGMAPIIGEPADALNTVLYFIQGIQPTAPCPPWR
jgi:hypothetical protein